MFYFYSLKLLVDIVARVFPGFEFRWLAEETRKNLPLELDFKHEARNSEKAAQQFSHLEFLKVRSFSFYYTSYDSIVRLQIQYLNPGCAQNNKVRLLLLLRWAFVSVNNLTEKYWKVI